jgi:hypothetical protein
VSIQAIEGASKTRPTAARPTVSGPDSADPSSGSHTELKRKLEQLLPMIEALMRKLGGDAANDSNGADAGGDSAGGGSGRGPGAGSGGAPSGAGGGAPHGASGDGKADAHVTGPGAEKYGQHVKEFAAENPEFKQMVLKDAQQNPNGVFEINRNGDLGGPAGTAAEGNGEVNIAGDADGKLSKHVLVHEMEHNFKMSHHNHSDSAAIRGRDQPHRWARRTRQPDQQAQRRNGRRPGRLTRLPALSASCPARPLRRPARRRSPCRTRRCECDQLGALRGGVLHWRSVAHHGGVAQLRHACGQLHAVVDAELAKHTAHVRAHGRKPDAQALRDFLVADAQAH